MLDWPLVSVELVEPMSRGLVINLCNQVDHVVIELRGGLHLRDVPRVREAAAKSLLGTGRVLIDLSSLRCAQATFVTVFPTALAFAGGWPAARLVLFGADAAMRSTLSSARITETVHLAADLPSAHALLEQRPPQVRCHRDLPERDTAPAAARALVREVCDVWSVPQDVRETAELVSTELVSNAVEHAHSSSRLTITYTGAVFRISVRDYGPPCVPRTRPIDVCATRGRGLHIVAALAHAWGVDQHPDGKTLWVTLQPDSSVRLEPG